MTDILNGSHFFLLEMVDAEFWRLIKFELVKYFIQVREHLEIFAALKGVKEDILERDVTDMVNEVSFSSFNLDLSFIFHSIL